MKFDSLKIITKMIAKEVEIDSIIGGLESGGKTITPLPYDGYLHLEHDVPFLMIYRKVPDDAATIRLVRTTASFLIVGTENFEYYHEFVNLLTEKMSTKFRSFIVIEIYSGSSDSNEFIIRGPSHKLPVSLNVLKKELDKIESHRYEKPLTARVEQTKERQPPSQQAFFSIEKIKNHGGTYIGIEIPPVYRSQNGTVYPLYFRKFRDNFAKAIHKALFEFIRVQTSSEIKNYAALGRRRIHEELFKIDRQLTQIENQYQFLLLIAPVNIQSIESCFFETDFEKVLPYHYRLLPLDPDLLKRELYTLRIDEIDDPELSFLYQQKRNQIDQELTMLKERGSKNFFYSSLRLYGVIEKKLWNTAKEILEHFPEDTNRENEKTITAEIFADMAAEEFEYFKEQSPDFNSKIHIREDVNVMMVSKGELYIPAHYTMTERQAKALIQHEVGTHVLTYYNGSRQPLSQLSQGLANYEALQEGMAILAEYLVDGLTKNRLRTLAGRVVAGEALLDDATFRETFMLLYRNYGFSKDSAFAITSRMFQGCGFLKDIIYLRGFMQLMDYLKENDLEILLSGKMALEHVPMIQDLKARNLVKTPEIIPRYMKSKTYKNKLSEIKNETPIHKLI